MMTKEAKTDYYKIFNIDSPTDDEKSPKRLYRVKCYKCRKYVQSHFKRDVIHGYGSFCELSKEH